MANATRGDFVWYEHMTKDTRAGIAFYTEVMGWKTQPFTTPGDPDYVMFVSEQGPLGGITTLPPQAVAMGAPPHWMAHVVVDDVDAAAALVEKLGGKLFVGPLDVATIGRFAVISDPQGAILSVFKPSSPMTLHEVKNGEVCWRELHTTNSTAALAFYEQLFGWKLGDAMDMGPMGTYSIFDVNGQRAGGMINIPEGANRPPSWLYYVDVDDLDAAVARVTSRGGTIAHGPMSVPGGARVAMCLDSQGAAFGLHCAKAS